MYMYPSNLKAKASLLFWTLRDVLIALVLALLGMFALSRNPIAHFALCGCRLCHPLHPAGGCLHSGLPRSGMAVRCEQPATL